MKYYHNYTMPTHGKGVGMKQGIRSPVSSGHEYGRGQYGREQYGREQYSAMRATGPPPPGRAYHTHHHPYYPPPHYAPPPSVEQRAPQSMPQSPSSPVSPWACDFCQAATFRTYEEASAHEQVCPMNRHAMATSPRGAPATPTMHTSPPRTPRAQQRQPHAAVAAASSPKHDDGKCILLLSTPGDQESLSDRQCYVRREFVEVFTATDADVAARHSKGAQKLHAGQVGIRCVFCTHMHPKDRAERAMCYPSSISRIYQTVADMQRFHFEACTAIPEEMKHSYRNLKTTRPRGVGSPQSYWISSAKELGLVDTSEGIHHAESSSPSAKHVKRKAQSPPAEKKPKATSPALCATNTPVTGHSTPVQLPGAAVISPSATGSHQRTAETSMMATPSPFASERRGGADLGSAQSFESPRDSEAIILLSLKNTGTAKPPQYRPSSNS
uniref:Uncharacterized protein n=1 Tax=Odontella aurita TaxID=265563 RepID=A0A7S4JKY7_9STRA|mmetsp:Transcript_47829/g.144666  ORF Transcript_47829/g.144666 Transcript_47829/m.144666 type:complete len:441 (+) Transcript_47829:179-1501(+)